jgi:hypothetical protein
MDEINDTEKQHKRGEEEADAQYEDHKPVHGPAPHG